MLPIVLFVAFWVVLGFGLFFVAVRGGLGGAREALQTQSYGGRRVVTTIFVITYAGLGFAVPLVLLSGNHANANGQVGGIKLTAAEKRGRELFGLHCAVCHTLAAANAVGMVGPNLDSLRPPRSLVLRTIVNGCLANAPGTSPQACLGQGTMPADIVQGRQATDVADFVARVAGKE